MTDINDGGPAFPHTGVWHKERHTHGMTLRDWFAGQALKGILSKPTTTCDCGDCIECVNPEKWERATMEANVEVAWEHADAMLKEREVNNG